MASRSRIASGAASDSLPRRVGEGACIGALLAIALGVVGPHARGAEPENAPANAALPKPPLTETWFFGVPHLTAPTPEDRVTARDLYATGNEKLNAGDYAGALEDLRGAHALVAVPSTGYRLGEAQAKMGLLLQAAATLQRVQRYPHQLNEPPVFATMRAQAGELAKKLVARTPKIFVQVSGAPAEGHRLKIDGMEVPASALKTPVPVNPGSHEVTVTAQWREPATKTVTVTEGQDAVVKLTLRPSENQPRRAATGAAAAEPKDDVPLWATASLSVGAGSLVTAVVTGAISFSMAKHLESTCPDNACADDQRDAYDTMLGFANASNASFVLAGVAVAVGLGGVLGAKSGKSGERVSLSPTLGGAQLRATF